MALQQTWSGNTLQILNGATAGLHFVWAFVLIILWGVNKNDDGDRNDLVYPLYSSFSAWTDATANPPATIEGSSCSLPKALLIGDRMAVTPGWKDSGMELSLHWLVVIFFLISGSFQMLTAVVNGYVSSPTIRFIEYSWSASVMIVAIALQLGIMHVHTLILLAALVWATMMCGLACEKTRATWKKLDNIMKIAESKKNDAQSALIEQKDEIKLKGELTNVIWLTHTIGWAMLSVTFFVLLSTFHGSQKSCDSPDAAPNFVWAIVYGELFMFAFFGFVQMLQIFDVLNEEMADMAYIVLSFTSKTLLGWLVYAGQVTSVSSALFVVSYHTLDKKT
jgi:hypothetical protein